MSLMQRGGMSAMDAIVAGTGRAAKVMGIDDEVGTLGEGLAADVIVVGGDPLENLDALRDLRLVLQGGQVRSRDGLMVPAQTPPRRQ
jgi:imidazolonepropionase-like amidohydrolase